MIFLVTRLIYNGRSMSVRLQGISRAVSIDFATQLLIKTVITVVNHDITVFEKRQLFQLISPARRRSFPDGHHRYWSEYQW